MKHRRMGGIAINPVGPARGNDFNRWHHCRARVFFDVLTGVTHLNRTGVGTKQQRLAAGIGAINVKRILHRSCGVIFRAIERCEIKPIGFDLRAIGNIKADRMKDRLHPFPGSHHRVQTAHGLSAARQGYVDGFSSKARLQYRISQFLAALLQRHLDCGLHLVD